MQPPGPGSMGGVYGAPRAPGHPDLHPPPGGVRPLRRRSLSRARGAPSPGKCQV